jgi:protein-tyrosine phosphatase
VTPHVHPGRYENTLSTIREAVTQFRQALATAHIPLAIHPAGEVRFSAEVMNLFDNEELPYLGELNGYRIVLLEFPHGHLTAGADKLVRWLTDRKVRPMIAHPERNKEVIHKIEKIRPFIDMGCMLQVTSASVIGRFGRPVEECVWKMLDNKWVAVIATDAHNLESRPPVMSMARDLLIKRGLQSLSVELTQTMPGRIMGMV